jgi:hypothetical protein
MNNYQDEVVALSRIASEGSRPQAEAAGYPRGMYTHVLAERRNLPLAVAQKIGDLQGFTPDGFSDHSARSYLCRDDADLELLESLGFQIFWRALIQSRRELNGGVVLQRYAFITLVHGNTWQDGVLRMSTPKFTELLAKRGLNDLPSLVVETEDIGCLNRFQDAYESDSPRVTLGNQFFDNQSEFTEYFEGVVEGWINNAKQKIPTHIKHSLYPELRLFDYFEDQLFNQYLQKFSVETYLYPVFKDVQGVDAMGVQEDGTPVFIEIRYLTPRMSLLITRDQMLAQHLLVFRKQPNSIYALTYDGPTRQVIDVLENRSIKVSAMMLLQNQLGELNKSVELGKRLKMR